MAASAREPTVVSSHESQRNQNSINSQVVHVGKYRIIRNLRVLNRSASTKQIYKIQNQCNYYTAMIPITCHSSKMARTTTTDIEIDLRNFPGFCDLFSVICQIFVSRLQSDSEFEVENTEVAVNNRTSSISRSVYPSSFENRERFQETIFPERYIH